MSAISTWHPSRGTAIPVEAGPLVVPVRSRFARWTVLWVGLAVVLGAGWWVTNSPVFDLRGLHVRGNDHLTQRQVASLAGLDAHTNVLWLNAGALTKRLESSPWIRDARVSRDLPSGITITIEERAPVAVTGGEHPMLVAGDGTVLGRARARAGAGDLLPSIDTPGRLSAGDRVSGSALRIAASLPSALAPLVDTIGGEPSGPLTVHMRDGVTAVYGDASSVGAKSESLQAVLSWARRNGVHPSSVDVTAPAAPAIRP